MNQAAFFILLIIVILLLTTGGPGSSDPILDEYKSYLNFEKELLFKSEYHLGYGNLTGFRLSYQDNVEGKNALSWPFRSYTYENPWEEKQEDSLLPNEISDEAKRLWGTDRAVEDENAYLFNITGEAIGEFDVVTPKSHIQSYNLQLPSALKEYFNKYQQEKYEEEWQRYREDPENHSPPPEQDNHADKNGNITRFKNGDMTLEIYKSTVASYKLDPSIQDPDLFEDATLLFLNLELSDKNSAESHAFGMQAVYFHDTGSMVGLTKSAKFRGAIALPHFTLNAANHNKTKVLMERLLNSTSSADELSIDDVTKTVKNAETLCELVAFFQFKKTGLALHRLRLIDDELHHPLGMPLYKDVPQIEVDSALMYSPDCALVFQKTPDVPFVGDQSVIKSSKIKNALIALLGLSLVENKLFMRQMKFGSTPTQLSNISSITIGLISGYDLMILMLMLLLIWTSDLYLLSASIAVFKGILFYVLETPYRSSIEATQLNERGTTWWQILRASGRETSRGLNPEQSPNSDLEAQSASPGPSQAGTNAEPAPINQEFIAPSEQNRSFFVIIFFTFAFLALLMLQSMSWNATLYRVVRDVLLLGLHSFWFPQFMRSTLKNRPKYLSWEFVWGITIMKLIPVAYFTLKKRNPFKDTYEPSLFCLVAGWMGIQISLLYLQSKLGARFWITDRFLPEQYNYHPIIHIQALPRGFVKDDSAKANPSAGPEVSMYCGDCVICMGIINLPILMEQAEGKKYANLMDGIMVTPCHHLFHTPCLESWMKYKLQCPVCRSAIPPV